MEYVTVPQLSEMVGVTQQTIYNRIKQSLIPVTMLRGKKKIELPFAEDYARKQVLDMKVTRSIRERKLTKKHMAKALQYLCDYCGSVVGGFDKQAVVKDTYIQIKGQVLIENWDDKNNRRAFFYATSNRNDELTFCYSEEGKGSECFTGFVELQKKKWLEKQDSLIDSGKAPEAGYREYGDAKPRRPFLK